VFLYLFIIVELNDVQGLCFLYFLILFYHSLGVSLEESLSLSLMDVLCLCGCYNVDILWSSWIIGHSFIILILCLLQLFLAM